MKKNTVDLILRFADGKGKIRKNVIINEFINKFDNFILQIQNFQTKIYSIDFKLMNGIKTLIQFHLAGILDLIRKNNNNKIITNTLDNDDFHNKVYGLYAELLKLIDAMICDLRSGCEYIDLISLHDTLKYICELYDFAKNLHSNDLTVTQEMIIDEKLFELFDLYNEKVSLQIFSIENNNNWLAANNASNYFHYLQISSFLNSSNYELNKLHVCKINYSISNNSTDIDNLFLE
jgi:hypothetical protein